MPSGWENVCVATGAGRKGMLYGAALGLAATEIPLQESPALRSRLSPRSIQSRPMSLAGHAPIARRAAFHTACTGCGKQLRHGFHPTCPDCGAMTDISYDLNAVQLRESEIPICGSSICSRCPTRRSYRRPGSHRWCTPAGWGPSWVFRGCTSRTRHASPPRPPRTAWPRLPSPICTSAASPASRPPRPATAPARMPTPSPASHSW